VARGEEDSERKIEYEHAIEEEVASPEDELV
jgi:hypothetical protein